MEEQKKRINKILLILIIIGIIKFLLGIAAYYFYSKPAVPVISDFLIGFLLFETFADGTTGFIAQPVAVLVYSIISCRKRHKIGVMSRLDISLAIICFIVWALAACTCWQATMLGF